MKIRIGLTLKLNPIVMTNFNLIFGDILELRSRLFLHSIVRIDDRTSWWFPTKFPSEKYRFFTSRVVSTCLGESKCMFLNHHSAFREQVGDKSEVQSLRYFICFPHPTSTPAVEETDKNCCSSPQYFSNDREPPSLQSDRCRFGFKCSEHHQTR